MIKINHILPVVCFFLFVQCANQARLSDDIEALKKQVTDNGKRSRALEAEATALKQALTDNYVDTIELNRRIQSLLPPAGMTAEQLENFGMLKKTVCSTLEFVKYFKEVFKPEIDKKSSSEVIGNLRGAIADCKEALDEYSDSPGNIANSSSVPATITTPVRTSNTSPRSEVESAATASIRSSPE